MGYSPQNFVDSIKDCNCKKRKDHVWCYRGYCYDELLNEGDKNNCLKEIIDNSIISTVPTVYAANFLDRGPLNNELSDIIIKSLDKHILNTSIYFSRKNVKIDQIVDYFFKNFQGNDQNDVLLKNHLSDTKVPRTQEEKAAIIFLYSLFYGKESIFTRKLITNSEWYVDIDYSLAKFGFIKPAPCNVPYIEIACEKSIEESNGRSLSGVYGLINSKKNSLCELNIQLNDCKTTQIIFVIGTGGMGKSTTLKSIAEFSFSTHIMYKKIDLKDYNSKSGLLGLILGDIKESYKESLASVLSNYKTCKNIIALDAFDEMPLECMSDFIKELNEIAFKKWKNTTFVISSRYLLPEINKSFLKNFPNGKCITYSLNDISIEGIAKFLNTSNEKVYELQQTFGSDILSKPYFVAKIKEILQAEGINGMSTLTSGITKAKELLDEYFKVRYQKCKMLLSEYYSEFIIPYVWFVLYEEKSFTDKKIWKLLRQFNATENDDLNFVIQRAVFNNCTSNYNSIGSEYILINEMVESLNILKQDNAKPYTYSPDHSITRDYMSAKYIKNILRISLNEDDKEYALKIITDSKIAESLWSRDVIKFLRQDFFDNNQMNRLFDAMRGRTQPECGYLLRNLINTFYKDGVVEGLDFSDLDFATVHSASIIFRNCNFFRAKGINKEMIYPRGHKGRVTGLVVLDDDVHLVSSGTDGKIILWSIAGGILRFVSEIELNDDYIVKACSKEGCYNAIEYVTKSGQTAAFQLNISGIKLNDMIGTIISDSNDIIKTADSCNKDALVLKIKELKYPVTVRYRHSTTGYIYCGDELGGISVYNYQGKLLSYDGFAPALNTPMAVNNGFLCSTGGINGSLNETMLLDNNLNVRKCEEDKLLIKKVKFIDDGTKIEIKCNNNIITILTDEIFDVLGLKHSFDIVSMCFSISRNSLLIGTSYGDMIEYNVDDKSVIRYSMFPKNTKGYSVYAEYSYDGTALLAVTFDRICFFRLPDCYQKHMSYEEISALESYIENPNISGVAFPDCIFTADMTPYNVVELLKCNGATIK